MVLVSSHAPEFTRYRQLIEHTPEALMLGDGAGRILDANQQALDLFGYTLDEMVDGPPWGLCDATDQRFHESVHTRANAGRSDFQMRMRRKDGSVFEARIWSALFEEDGHRRSWIGVTPLGAPEPAKGVLLRANAMLSAVIAGAPEGIIVVDDAGNVVHVNDRFLQTWNLEPTFALLPMERRRAAAMPLLKEPGQFTREMEMLAADRDLVLHDFIHLVDGRTLEMHSHPLTAPGGERIGRIWYYADVSQAVATRSQLTFNDVLLEAYFELSRDAAIVVGDDGTAILYNQQFLDLWGLTPGQMNLPQAERWKVGLRNLGDVDTFLRRISSISGDPDAEVLEPIEFADGRILEMASAPFSTVDGRRLGRIWQFRDISAWVRGQRALESADTLLEAQFSLSHDGMVVLSDSGEILRASTHFHELMLADGRRWVELPFEEREAALTAMAADEAQSLAFNQRWMNNPGEYIEETFELKDGSWMELRTLPLVTNSGERLGRLFVYRDMTRRRREAKELEDANVLLAAQFEHAPHATLVIGNDDRVIRASQSFFEFTGLPREWADLPVEERRAQLQRLSVDPAKSAAFNDRWRQYPEEDLLSMFQTTDGRHWEVRSRPLRDGHGEMLGRIFFYANVTDRLRAEETLRRSEERIRTTLEALEEGVILIDARGSVVLGNSAASRVLGMDMGTLRGSSLFEQPWHVVREDGTPFSAKEFPVAESLEEGTIHQNVVMGFLRGTGETAWLLVNSVPLFEEGAAKPAGAVASFVDITDRRKLEASAARLRQHESLAVLAGGVSHKLNNLLTSIIGNAWVAAQMPALPQELAENVADISRAAESAALLVGDLRSFAAPSYQLHPGVAINDCVSAAVGEMALERRERLELHLGARLPHITANADGLRRSIVNLLENAFESGSATVTVTTRMLEWEPTPAVVFSTAEPPAGKWLCVEVQDTGSGIAAREIERAFEPFYTTGFAGSGLGLPAAAGIIREHGGFLGLESTEGKGTTARIFLPPGIAA